MARIQSSVGLITGIPITDTVDQLMQIAARPRDLLTSRTEGLESQQVAIAALSARLLATQISLNKLIVNSVYDAREVASSNTDVLTATLASGANPPVGSFDVRTVQTATAHQLFSQRFEDLTSGFGAGTLDFGFGGIVDEGISLDELNDGAGVTRGQIQITDRSGTSAVIDLSTIRSVDDVLQAINNDTTVNVTLVATGDTFKLIDNTGGSGTLSVQEVGTGTTAADLGLDGISTMSSEATGTDVFQLHTGTNLSFLNDSNGVQITDSPLDDLTITLLDGTVGSVDLSGSTTLSDVIDAINNDANLTGKITAAISADGNRLELTDGSGGGGTFSVVNGATSTAADDLGLTVTAAGATITGNRLVSGLRDTLLSSLNGGQGPGTLGDIDITDRNAGNDIVDLSTAETLGDVIDLINASTADVTAAINTSRGGITITDTSVGSGNLIIADSGATTSATALGIVVNAAQASIDSGRLNRQSISEQTLLSSLNGGAGVALGDISVTDTNGKTVTIDLNTLGTEAETVGDIIDRINAAAAAANPLGVSARINDTGDGILIIDTVSGASTLGVKDLTGTVAKSLNLTRASTTAIIDSVSTVVVDGAERFSVDLTDLDGSPTSITLASLNGGAGISAGDFTITDSTGTGITAVDFNGADAGIATIGELIDLINTRAAAGGADVTASINSGGTGILLTDNAGGTEKLTVKDINASTAADLNLAGEATGTTIDGASLFSAQSTNQSVMDKLADRINDLKAGVTAATVFDGLGFRLSLTVDQTGTGNELLLDPGTSVLVFEQVASAQDALVVFGEQSTPGSGVLISSRSNNFDQLVSGVDLKIVAVSATPVTVTVSPTDTSFVSAVEDFVSSYNSLRDDLDSLTDFDETELTVGLLFGSNEALRVDTELSRLVTDRFLGLGNFETLAEIGIDVDDKGQLQLDKSKLQQAFTDDPSGLQTFFGDKTKGVVTKFNALIDQLAGEDNSLLTNRSDALQRTIDANQLRIDRFNEQLDRQRERMLLQFFQLEQIIAKLQQGLSALQALKPLEPLSIRRDR